VVAAAEGVEVVWLGVIITCDFELMGKQFLLMCY